MSLIRKSLFALAFAFVALAGYDLATFDRAAWQSDYARLKSGMAQGYANLDWLVEQRDLDLVAIDQRTSDRLDGAVSHVQAYFAMRDFIGEFDDPHLSLQRGAPPESARLLPMQSAVAPALDCGDAGYEEDELVTDLAYPSMADWQPVESPFFPAGTLGDVGVVRIAAFGENKYLAACRDAQARATASDPRALQLATRDRLNAAFAETLAKLEAQGARRLVIDVTGNGGGSEWIGDIAAMLSDTPLSRNAPQLAAADCDRSAIWQGTEVCPILRPSGTRETVEGRGNWTGPVALFIDGASASATEGFAVWLADNDRATLVGSRTFGAGCGYIDGGHAVAFDAAPLHVMMPNCARFTAEGVNEIEGIAPDIETDLAALGATDYPALFERAFALP